MTSTLQEFIHSLNPRTLPRVLQIQSGIYFQGSVYEMFGNECSLSTGEVIKVNSFKIKKVMANTCKENEDGQCSPKFELPLNFPGLFKIMTDRIPYHTMDDITRAVYIGPNRLSHPCFYHQKDINLGNLTISPGEPIMLNSIEEINGEMMVNCGVVRDNQNHSFTIPLSQEGEFYECEDEHMYTLKEIAEWKIPKSRKRIVKFTDISNKWNSVYPLPKDFDGLLSLTPIYEIQAVMKLLGIAKECPINCPSLCEVRKDIVRILSDLDVEVKDITDCYDAKCFLQLLSTEDLFEKTGKEFPMAVEVIEGPQGNPLASGLLQPGKTIVIHKKYQASRILASEIRSDSPKRHFLIPTSYKGKFKRRPREFPTAYDLEIVKSDNEQLHVVATKGFDSPYEELSSVSVGDQFLVQRSQTSEVLCKGIKKEVGVLACEKILKKAYEPVLLPLYMEGGFIEVIHDKKQYQLSKLCTQFRLPFNVKVSVRDLSIEDDILAATPGLQLEEEITDSYLLISDLTNPSESWEIPVSRLGMSVQLVSSTVDVIDSFPVRTIVEEISEEQYYMMRRYENLALHPPPRPPKKPSIMEKKPDFLVPPKINIMDPPKSPKSLHVETAKNLHSQQATAALKLPVSCQIDLTHPETEQDVIRTTALAETRVMRASAKTVLIKDDLERKLKDEHDHKHISENLVENVKQKLQERTFHSKTHS